VRDVLLFKSGFPLLFSRQTVSMAYCAVIFNAQLLQISAEVIVFPTKNNSL